MWSPPLILEALTITSGKAFVVRDDRLAGGTKQRAAVPYLKKWMGAGIETFVYASPFCGFAQIALAAACREIGARCVLFCEQDQGDDIPLRAHPCSLRAQNHGADVRLYPSLAEAESAAQAFANRANVFKVPLGFDDSAFRDLLSAELARQWELVVENLGRQPGSLWISVGSGTLARTFRSVLPMEVEIRGIDVHVLTGGDERIAGLAGILGAPLISAPEVFPEPARRPPSQIDSNRYYDAKVWRYVHQFAEPGDLWWNIAG